MKIKRILALAAVILLLSSVAVSPVFAEGDSPYPWSVDPFEAK